MSWGLGEPRRGNTEAVSTLSNLEEVQIHTGSFLGQLRNKLTFIFKRTGSRFLNLARTLPFGRAGRGGGGYLTCKWAPEVIINTSHVRVYSHT